MACAISHLQSVFGQVSPLCPSDSIPTRTHPIPVVPKYECRRFRTVGYNAGQIDDAPLVHMQVRAALNADVWNWNREKKEPTS